MCPTALKICQILIQSQSNAKIIFKQWSETFNFYQSGKISPNLVKLFPSQIQIHWQLPSLEKVLGVHCKRRTQIFLYFRLFRHDKYSTILTIYDKVACLVLKPGAAGWWAQTNPLSYGGTLYLIICLQFYTTGPQRVRHNKLH